MSHHRYCPQASDIFEALTEGYRLAKPDRLRPWHLLSQEPVRPLMFRSREYVGVAHFIPPSLENWRHFNAFPRDWELQDCLSHGKPFIARANNPNRIAFFKPTPGGWLEHEAAFANTPRSWQKLVEKYDLLRLNIYPGAFTPRVSVPRAPRAG